MCMPSAKVPGPSADEIKAREASRRAQRDALKEERITAEEQKAEQLQITQAALQGKQGRRSLLTGRKGGSGFDVSDTYQSKKTLGA